MEKTDLPEIIKKNLEELRKKLAEQKGIFINSLQKRASECNPKNYK